MDVKLVMFAFLVLAALIMSSEAGKRKKVVIHVPFKVKKIKHTHTVYKTIHHHHGHGGGHGGYKSHSTHEEHEDHEHFHHHGEVHGHHSLQHPVYALPNYGHASIPMYRRR